MSIKIMKGQNGVLNISFPYDYEIVAKIKQVEGRKWNAKEKLWSVQECDSILETLMELFGGYDLALDPTLKITCKPVKEGLLYESMIVQGKNSLKLKGYSPKTQKAYLGHIRRFLTFYAADPKTLTENDVRNYLLHF